MAAGLATVRGMERAGQDDAGGVGSARGPAGDAGGAALSQGQLLGAVFVGGAVGTLLRAALATWFPHDAGGWPWATLGVNVVGAFVLGWASVWLAAARHDARLRLLVTTGFCGGLTTFATLQVELVELAADGAWGVAAGYLALTLAAGLCAALAGRAVGARGPARGSA